MVATKLLRELPPTNPKAGFFVLRSCTDFGGAVPQRRGRRPNLVWGCIAGWKLGRFRLLVFVGRLKDVAVVAESEVLLALPGR